ncbi:hypothetical protein [Arcobacter sp. LA11]|uniref:hypothetical protein n=1 Tax=Arcobacter sp. LA11 TaxID=1898176 RepID=UPI0009337A83|nr:hypothetical protein [Arcobacter sp. LA11]
MSKFKYKKSVNEESLQPIVKVVQNKQKEDKHYYDREKYGLINYLKSESKEGKIQLFEKGKVEEIGLKHIIISPCKVSRWEKLDKEEQLNLRERFISKLQNDFKDKNYLLAIEEKPRKNEYGENINMEHYHLVVSNKIPTDKPFKVNYKKSLMTNYIQFFTKKETREKLGVKTFNEMKESKIEKIKSYYENKKHHIIAKSEIDTLYQISRGIFEDKKSRFNFSRTQKYYILKEKKNLFKEISSVKKSISHTLLHIKTINDSIKSLKEYKNSFVFHYVKEMKTYRNNCFKSLKDFTLYTNKEHNFFEKLQNQKLKNGEINQESFITSVVRSKNYWKNEQRHKRRQIEENLKYQQDNINRQIRNLDVELILLLENKENQEKIKKLFSEKINVKNYLLSNNSLKMYSQEEILSNKLELYNSYLKFVKSQINTKKQALKQSPSYEQKNLK